VVSLNSIASLARIVEFDEAWQLVVALIGLEQITRAFLSAVELFDFSGLQLEEARSRRASEAAANGFYDYYAWKETSQRFAAWQHMAARDGALQIYHFGKAIEKSRGQLNNVPSVRAFVDLRKLRTAARLFVSYFPNHALIRDACAHSLYEFAPSASAFRSHAPDAIDIPGVAKGRGIFITNTICGNRYIVTKDKKVASYEISKSTYGNLEAVRVYFISGFDQARAQVSKNSLLQARRTNASLAIRADGRTRFERCSER
jgi:hypothetical protein